MKKKIIIPICIVVVLLVVGITIFLITKNKSATIITIEINPSIEIHLDKEDNIIKLVALNDDAKDLIDNNLKGKHVNEYFEYLTQELINKDYIKDELILLMNVDGKEDVDTLQNGLFEELNKKEVDAQIIIIDNITKEDKKLAKEYNISPTKAAYINSIVKDNENVKVEDLIERPIKELKTTKETGFYCEEGWTLDADWCTKAIETIDAKYGETCPERYSLRNGKCYEEVDPIETDNVVCNNEFKRVGDKCIRTQEFDAEPVKYSCAKGEAKTRLEAGLTREQDGDAKNIVCVDMSQATHPVTPCEANDGTEYTVVGGVCYWHRAPVIAEGCPGKVQVGGMCWDNATGIYICPGYRDGKQYKSRDEWCEHSIKYTQPTVTEYKCTEEGTKLEGNKCIREEIEDPHNERICPSNSKKDEFERCVTNNTTNKVEGYYCEDPAYNLEGTSCVRYEHIRANK